METLDFVSALYLGMTHPSAALRPWASLTTGVPVALGRPVWTARAEMRLTSLMGGERASLYPSTLHLFWDLFSVLARGAKLHLHVDHGAYPIITAGVERASCGGAVTSTFRGHDPSALAASLERTKAGATPVVVADGVCTGCGRTLPIDRYAALAARRGGLLVIDDTQALGLLGEGPRPGAPLGRGGGGSARYHGLSGGSALIGGSFAKALGVPVAALSGPSKLIARIEERSDVRVCSSPPSRAAVAALEHALSENEARGDELRRALSENISLFRAALAGEGLCPHGGALPIQSLRAPALATPSFRDRLARMGVRCFLFRSRCEGERRLGFVITARHRASDILRCAEALSRARRQAGADNGSFEEERVCG